MFILPTYKRPEKLKNAIKAYIDTKATAPIYLVIQGNPELYEGIEYPDTWTVVVLKENIGLVAAFNYVFNKFPDETYYGLTTDDQHPITEHWDKKLIEAITPWNIVTCQDTLNKNDWRMSGITVIGGDLIRYANFIFPPCTWHICGDDWWELVAKTCNNWIKIDAQSTHITPETTGIEPDETYKSSYTDFSGQVSRYNQWLVAEGNELLSKIQKNITLTR
tara:strand:+ start:1224 stop:1883 length:660 start_codon:yes stop_codon:yes gene_type:complete